MNTTARGYPTGDLRVSDADRDAALSELSEHFQAGRLNSTELARSSPNFGGSMIITTTLQIILNHVDCGMSLPLAAIPLIF